ncbi:MAG: LPXTG cell wall anchor domain-containing protein [Leifsonia sp.]
MITTTTAVTASPLLAETGVDPAFTIVVAFAALLTGVALYIGLRRRHRG